MELIAVAGSAIQKAAAEFADGVTENIETVPAAALLRSSQGRRPERP